jgi:hypothetical protein
MAGDRADFVAGVMSFWGVPPIVMEGMTPIFRHIPHLQPRFDSRE